MVGTILLGIVFLLCVLLLLPLRVTASFGEGKWAVTIRYAFLRIYHLASKPKPQPVHPPTPDSPDAEKSGTTPDADEQDSPPPQPKNATKESQTVTPKPETQSQKEPVQPASDADKEKPDASETAETDKEEPESEEEPETEEEPAAETDAEAEKKPQKRGYLKRLKPANLSEGIALVKDGLSSLSPALKCLTRHFHFRHVKLYLSVGSDDAAKTALLYGRICAAFYPLLGQLESWLDFQADELRILADFYGDKLEFRGAMELRVSPAAIIATALILVFRFFFRTFFRFRHEDKAEKRHRKEAAPLPETV